MSALKKQLIIVFSKRTGAIYDCGPVPTGNPGFPGHIILILYYLLGSLAQLVEHMTFNHG